MTLRLNPLPTGEVFRTKKEGDVTLTVSVKSQSPSHRGSLSHLVFVVLRQLQWERLNPLRIWEVFRTGGRACGPCSPVNGLNPLRIGEVFRTRSERQHTSIFACVSIPFASGKSFAQLLDVPLQLSQ